MRTTVLLTAALAASLLTRTGATQSLVYDFSQSNLSRSGNPSPAVVMGGIAYFTATDQFGTELWRTDGSASGTYRVKDLEPGDPTSGLPSSAPKDLTPVGNLLFFSAEVYGYGRELFVSDGTAAGTRLVLDILAQPDIGSNPQLLTPFQGRLYFTADDGTFGRELWSSDGTAAGTTRVTDIAPGSGPAQISTLTVWNGRLWFDAQDSVTRGRELWSSDGTAAGTQLLVDLWSGPASSSPQELTAAQGNLFFTAQQSAGDRELYATDGTVPGTRRVADIHPTAGSFPSTLVATGPLVVFIATEPANGREVWRSDGTAAGTYLLRDIAAGSASSDATELTLSATGGQVYFVAGGLLLWITDGTVPGTSVLSTTLLVGRLAPAFGGIAFAGRTATTGQQLWIASGTNLAPVPGSPDPSFLSAYGGRVLFSARDLVVGQELFISDGTSSGLVQDLAPAYSSSSFSEMVDLNGRAFFSPVPVSGWSPWISDGTGQGTIEFQNTIGNPNQRVAWRGQAWFTGSTPTTGLELAVSDGTLSGTRVAVDIAPGVNTSAPQNLTPAGANLFFTALTPTSSRELWVTDGTPAGTRELDIWPGSGGSRAANLTPLGNLCFLSARSSSNDDEPWVSDGTAAGTKLLADLVPGTNGSAPLGFAPLGNRMFFSATTPALGRELYVTDGTTAGTGLFADLWPGVPSGVTGTLVSCETLLFFVATTPSTGNELWVTDGTLGGTQMLPEIIPGSRSPGISDLVGVHGRLFLLTDDQQHGSELWTSDGTASGTHLVVDLMPGFGHGAVAGTLVRIPGSQLVAFAGATDQSGLQLWVSDGTASGTVQLGNMGSQASAGAFVLRNFAVVGEKLFFNGGTEGSSGEELWVTPLAGPTSPLAVAYGNSQCPGTGGLVPRIAGVGVPRIGNAAFAIHVTAARPSSIAVVQLGLGQAAITLGSCTLLVFPLLLDLPPTSTNGIGSAGTRLPIPPNPTLAGLRLYGQYVVLDPLGALFGAFTLSDGLLFQVGL